MLGDNIRNARKNKRMTQEQLAQEIGVQRSVISKYENGTIDPAFGQLVKIANSLEVALDDLIGLSPDEKKEMEDRAECEAREDSVFLLGSSKKEIMEFMMMEKVESLRENAVDAALIEHYKEVSDLRLEGICVDCFTLLNRLGRIEVARRMLDMVEIPKYRKD